MNKTNKNLPVIDFNHGDFLISLMEYEKYHFCIKIDDMLKTPELYNNKKETIIKNDYWKISNVFYLYNTENEKSIDITQEYFERFTNLYDVENSIYNLKKYFQLLIDNDRKIESNNSKFGDILVHFMDLFYVEQNELPFNYIPELKILFDILLTSERASKCSFN